MRMQVHSAITSSGVAVRDASGFKQLLLILDLDASSLMQLQLCVRHAFEKPSNYKQRRVDASSRARRRLSDSQHMHPKASMVMPISSKHASRKVCGYPTNPSYIAACLDCVFAACMRSHGHVIKSLAAARGAAVSCAARIVIDAVVGEAMTPTTCALYKDEVVCRHARSSCIGLCPRRRVCGARLCLSALL